MIDVLRGSDSESSTIMSCVPLALSSDPGRMFRCQSCASAHKPATTARSEPCHTHTQRVFNVRRKSLSLREMYGCASGGVLNPAVDYRDAMRSWRY
jgi:hypothetical protein